MTPYKFLEECFDRGYREFSGSVMLEAQAKQLATDKKIGCVYWGQSDEYEFMARVFPDPDPKLSYIIVRATA